MKITGCNTVFSGFPEALHEKAFAPALSKNAFDIVSSIAPACENLIRNLKSLYSQTENSKLQTLSGKLKKKYGLAGFSDTSITFFNKKREITISVSPDKRINIFALNTKKKPLGSVFVKDRKIFTDRNSKMEPAKANEFIEYYGSILDYKILQLRKGLLPYNSLIQTNPYFQCRLSDNMINELNKCASLQTVRKNQTSPDAPVYRMDEELVLLTDKIKNLYFEIKELFNNIGISKSVLKIKRSYPYVPSDSENIRPGIFMNNVIRQGEDLAVNYIRSATKENVLTIQYIKGDEYKNVIVYPDGRLYKNRAFQHSPTYGKKTAYYTAKEVDNPDFTGRLNKIITVLENYKAYIIKKSEELNAYRNLRKSEPAGIFEPEIREIMSTLHERAQKCREILRKYSRKPYKQELIKKFNISSASGHYAISLKNIIPYEIFLTGVTHKNNFITRIFVMDENRNIKESFHILDNKLLKFCGKTFYSAFGESRHLKYYNREDVEKSNLYKYLRLISKKMDALIKEESEHNEHI